MGRKPQPKGHPFKELLEGLRLVPDDWEIGFGFSKSVFHGGGRGVSVSVTNLKSGETRHAWRPAQTKRKARDLVPVIARELLLSFRTRGD